MKAALLFMMILLAAGAHGGTVSGVIRDEQGAPQKGAQVTLTNDNNSADPIATTSDDQGRYHFPSVPAGAYHLLAKDQSATISVSAAFPDVTMDLTLLKAASRPQFEASGIRGLIDPGGYSASTSAAAASGLIKGIADIKRTGNDATPKERRSSPCSFEPALKKAVEQKPEDVEANLRLGDFYLDHGQATNAISLLEHVRSKDPRVVHQLAEAYLEAGRFDSAETLLTTPSAPTTEELRLLARAREGKGNFIAAGDAYQAAAKQEPSEENLFGAGYELILAGQPNPAARAFQDGLERYPRSAELLIGLGSAQFLEGNSSDSIHSLLRAAELNPADPRPYPFLAQASAVSRVDTEHVRKAFERFLSAAPDDPQASYDCALNLLQQHAADRANDPKIEGLLKQSIRLDPGLADAHFELGVLYGDRREYELASQELESAVRLSPNLQEAHYRLALAYRETGHKDLSAKEMQRFEEQRNTLAGRPSGGNIDQFISVFAAPKSPSKRENLCPADSPAHP